MSPSLPIELEFLLVSDDYATMQVVSNGVKHYGAKFVVVPGADQARDYLSRRKTDGVFLDMDVPGALLLIDTIRRGSSNNKVIIFACSRSSKDYTITLNAGANFLLRKPVSIDSVVLHITIAKDVLVRERRRYFRHPVNLSVILKQADQEQRARILNLSEGGMAVHTVKSLNRAAVVDFSFELPLGISIAGKGQVAWINAEGVAGIALQSFRGNAKDYLDSWLNAQEELSPNKTTQAP